MNHGKENFGAPRACTSSSTTNNAVSRPCVTKSTAAFTISRTKQTASGDGRLCIPLAEDTPSIQIGINQIMRGIVSNTIDHKTAWLLLYQFAAFDL